MTPVRPKRATMTITLDPVLRKELQDTAKRTHRKQAAIIEWGLQLVLEQLNTEREGVKL